MGTENQIGQSERVENIIKEDICVKCGACVGLCPYLKFYDGKIIVMDSCSAEEGRCGHYCPMIPLPEDESSEPVGEHEGIGKYLEILSARAASEEIRKHSQNGGVVTALLSCVLDNEILDAIVLTDKGDAHSPSGTCVGKSSEILDHSGSRYSASAPLKALNEISGDGSQEMGVVGLPCQMVALKKRDTYMAEKSEMNPVHLKIGLFCTWSLDYRAFSQYLKNKDVTGKILKYDIPPPPAEKFLVHMENDVLEFPLSDIRDFIQKGCTLCNDMTAKWADISVGAFEGREGWNTVIVRTERGQRIFQEALDKGVIETEPLTPEIISSLNEAAVNKMKRGNTAREEWTGMNK